ncbi:hypothetical protein IDH50_15910 [Aeromicrobium tamlense]|uniref:Uncharacterized protein n=1 Tax=Aeromicrobium tamlense TaxID=375541 RepID=A0A8I0KJ99_9ACTN|nr:hypothetical protein [Aeromicrobium tamlense]MBD1271730.1 hypothetical protein [Aeromicrobium tamlense]NYI37522.1 hypothetical protein [Aeromicrobium tamlense]
MSDFRSEPMPTAEGRGRARAAWDAYAAASQKVFGPAVETLLGGAIRSVSASTVADLVGFWVLWHLHGGFEGLLKLGMSRASIYRKVALFRKLFGKHPDEFEFPGITLDVATYFGTQEDQQET